MALLSDEEIVGLFQMRQTELADVLRRQRLARQVYENRLKVALPELDQSGMAPIANLLSQGADQLGQRIASNLPTPKFPVLKEHVKVSVQAAQDRRNVVSSWWEHDRLDLKMAKAARWFATYAASYTMVKPNMTRREPERFLRDPITSFPDSMGDGPEVGDCIFSYERPYAWLKRNYPDQASDLVRSDKTAMADKFQILEWVDEVYWCMIACGKPQAYKPDQAGHAMFCRLEQVQHMAGMTPVSAAGRITLDKPVGQFDGMIGQYYAEARLAALEIIAVEKGIFADTWWIGRQGMTPKIIRDADGLRGVTGIAQDADPWIANEQPGYKTDTTLDRLERAQRLDARIPAEFGGESGSNIRTGRRGDAVLAAVVDFPVQEAQRVFARSLQHENYIGIALDKAWWGNTSKTIWMGSRKTDYTPNVLWQDTYHTVSYSYAGSDVNSLAVGVLQRVGAGAMSIYTGMELDPLVDDPDHEYARVTREQLEKALLQGVGQAAATGGAQPIDIANMIKLLTDDASLADAVIKSQEMAQQRQAQQAPAGTPETQPGLSPPGVGAEQPTIPAAPQGTQNLAQLLHGLAAGARQGAPA